MKFVFRALLALSCVVCAQAIAQTYPAKAIRIVVPFPPRAFNDTLVRTIAQKFTEHIRTEVAKWSKVVKATGALIEYSRNPRGVNNVFKNM